ncbi:lipoprotein 17-related variable surface protein, partial [Mycoplasma bradburyae]
GIGSFVALSAASCKQPVAEKPTKPTDPKNPVNGGGGSTTDPSSGSGDNSNMNSNSGSDGSTGTGDSSSSTDNSGSSNGMTATNKAAVETYLNSLMPNDFMVVDSSGTEIVKDNTKATDVKSSNIKLKENNTVTEGWTLGVELVSDSANIDNGTVKFKVKFTKEGVEVTSNEIAITGFKTLKTSIANALLKSMTVKDESGQDVSKKALNLGSVGFKKLSELNNQTVVRTSSNNQPTISTRDAGSMDGAAEHQEQVSGLGAKFKELITTNESALKTSLDSIKTDYPEFVPEKLSLSGKAKLVNLWKGNDNDWHGNYYLTSKDDSNNKLSIKYADADWTIDLMDGLFVQDLLPDDVRISASIKKDDGSYTKSESNIEAYKNKIESEKNDSSAGKRYELSADGKDLKIKITVDNKDKYIDINPIKLPYIGPGKTNNIFFKAEYIFDEVAISDTDFFGTKLIFKKIHDATNGAKIALDSNVLNNPGNAVGIIPGRIDDETTDWKTVIPSSDVNYFFSKNDMSLGFDDSIHGDHNSSNGLGVVQLIENDVKSGNVFATKINDNNATSFIVFLRVAYKKSADTFGYYWPNSATILYFAAHTNTTTGNGVSA